MFHKGLPLIGSIIKPNTHGCVTALINSGRIRRDIIQTHRFPVKQVKETILMQQSDESPKC